MLSRKVIVPAALACLMSSVPWAAETADNPAGASASGADSVPGVWADKELKFTFMGFTTHYSCDGLRDKMRGVLLDLGADKKTLKVRESGCTSAAGRPEQFPGVRAKFRVMEPASESSSDHHQAPVPAHWMPVDLKLRDSSFTNDSGECELVEQIRQKVVPLFSTRNVDLNSNCIPHQASAARPTLKLEVLVPDAPPHSGAEPPAGQ